MTNIEHCNIYALVIFNPGLRIRSLGGLTSETNSYQ